MAITYVGAWRASMDAHFLWQDADWNSFTAKWNELSGQGLRLERITTFLDGGQRRWTGVWREGSGGHYLWAGVDWNGFTAKWNQLSAEGLRLARGDRRALFMELRLAVVSSQMERAVGPRPAARSARHLSIRNHAHVGR